jgi:Ca2+-binding RTX toxin-like protein
MGGAGSDTIHYEASNAAVVVDLASQRVSGGHASGDRIFGIESVVGSRDHADRLTGSAGSNRLSGLGGDDRLYGRAGDDVLAGGDGNDVLSGGAGNDTFLFDAPLGSHNVDRILDFTPGSDKIALALGVFAGLGGAGVLAAAAFHIGSAAADADDRIIYDPATGALVYDANGSEAGQAVRIATLATGLALSSDDVVVM